MNGSENGVYMKEDCRAPKYQLTIILTPQTTYCKYYCQPCLFLYDQCLAHFKQDNAPCHKTSLGAESMHSCCSFFL